MSTYGLTPLTFDGVDLDTDDYHFQFVEDAQTLDSPAAQAVKSTRPGLTPLRSYVQPDGMTLVMEAVIDEITQDNFDFLKGLFDTLGGDEHTLVVTDGNSVDRRIVCTVQKWTVSSIGNTVFKVALEAPSGIWLSDTAADNMTQHLDSPTDTFTLTNDGNTGAPLALTISPEAAIDADDGYSKAMRIWLANRSEQPLTHFAAEGYAIDITDGGIDTTGRDVQSDLSDLRVWLDGRELDRWLNVTSPDANTKIWCNIAMRPGRFATLGVDITDSDTALIISGTNTFEGWDRKGWMYIEDEPCLYEIADDNLTATLTRVDGASHSAGADITFIEHVLALTYGWNNADAPPEDADAKPVIDLDASSNTEHHWPGPFFNDNDRRSMTWRRVVEGDGSPNIRAYDDGTAMIFEDLLPETGKPLGDTVEVRFPVPCVGPLGVDYSVDVGIGLHGYAADLDGFESQLIEVLSGATTGSYSLDNEMTRLRLKAFISAITGEVGTSTSGDAFAFPAGFVGPGKKDDMTDYYTTGWLGIHFTLTKDTDVKEIAIQTDSGDTTIGFQIVSEDRTQLIYTGALFVGSDGDWSAGGVVSIIPAGSYWALFDTDANGNLLVKNRTKANTYDTYVILPGGQVFSDTGLSSLALDPTTGLALTNSEIAYPGEANFGNFDALPATHTPLFVVLSVKDDPQEDAPVQSGNKISIDNFIAPLDDTRSPKIMIGSEIDIFPIFGTLTNNATEVSAVLRHLCKVGESITIDSESGAITDDETGLEASYAVDYSNPTKRLYLAKGDNEFEIAIAGISTSAKLDITPTYRHAWL